jgi:hypothetical protein
MLKPRHLPVKNPKITKKRIVDRVEDKKNTKKNDTPPIFMGGGSFFYKN